MAGSYASFSPAARNSLCALSQSMRGRASLILKAAVGRDISVAAATAFQSQVASLWLEARGSAQGAALEEGLESSREDFAPAMQDRQLLRIFDQATQELGDGAKRLGGGNRPGMRAGDSDRRLSRMA